MTFRQLEVLDASFNHITDVSEDICLLPNLTTLRLDDNRIAQLPNNMFTLQRLECLTVRKNKLKQIQPHVRELTNVVELDISENIIEFIPVELSFLSKLQSLNIAHNKFAAIPCQLVELKSLQQFSLEWFMYATPSLPKDISTESTQGQFLMDSLFQLLNLLLKYDMQQCALITFLENFSEQTFDKNYRDNRQRTILHQAAVNGDTGVINGLLMDKAATDVLDKDQCTPLCLAIRQENFQAAQFLIDGGADVNKGGGIFGSPLHLSIVRLSDQIVQSLIEKNADLNILDQYGNSPMHLIMNIYSKNPTHCGVILDKLMQKGAQLNIYNDDNWAPIHIAVRKGQEAAIKAIINRNYQIHQSKIGQPQIKY